MNSWEWSGLSCGRFVMVICGHRFKHSFNRRINFLARLEIRSIAVYRRSSYFPIYFPEMFMQSNFTMLAFLYCLNLKVKRIKLSVHSILILCTMTILVFQKKSIQLVTIYNFFPLEVLQKCQLFHLCTLWENTIVSLSYFALITRLINSRRMLFL